MAIDLSVNYLAAIVAAVVSFIVGWLWYSPKLFGNAWMAASGIKKSDIAKSKKKGMITSMVAGFIVQVVMASVLGVFISATGGSGWLEGLNTGFWAWLGFVATIGLGIVIWEGKPMKLFWINSLHWLVALLIQGAILGAWM